MTSSFSRRWFLSGLHGAVLPVPALLSLLPRQMAHAQSKNDSIFIGLSSAFGGCWADKMFPALAAPEETLNHGGRTVRRASLKPSTANGATIISEVLQGESGLLTASLVGKMNCLQGIDIPFDINHHISGVLGNYAQGDAPSPVGLKVRENPRPTIDQVLAQSPSFYPTLDGVTQRSVSYSLYGTLSFGYKVKDNPFGGVVENPTIQNPVVLWESLFGSAMTPKPGRPSIVDLVYQDYLRVRSRPRLSALDKERLEQHIARIDDLKRRMSVTVSCTKPNKPTTLPFPTCANFSSQIDYYRSYEDILVAALSCGLTRVATVMFNGWDSTFGDRCQNDWHQEVSHKVEQDPAQNSMCAAMRRQFGQVIVPLASKLDNVKDSNGKSLLDRSLLLWGQEHGVDSHFMENIPFVTFGSANGTLRTGQHCDYRDLMRTIPTGQFGDKTRYPARVGLTIHQLLGSVLQAFGVPRSRYQESNHNGYGYRPPEMNDRQKYWRDAEWQVAGQKLPFL
jgi:Protein of unknown function (DUF1552)